MLCPLRLVRRAVPRRATRGCVWAFLVRAPGAERFSRCCARRPAPSTEAVEMTWEAVTAVTSAITTLVLIVTVIMASRQVQLLRRSTQLDGLIRILEEMDDPALIAAYHFVLDQLPARMQDATFRQSVVDGKTDESIQQYLPILRFFEKVGSFVKFGLLEPEAVYCQAGSTAVKMWNALQEVIACDRARGGPGVWDGFETLARGTVRYYRQMNPNFPGPYRSATDADAPRTG